MDEEKGDFHAQLLQWKDVATAASEAFDVWTHRREIVWAKLAWERLAACNLVAYTNEIERHEAAIRFLALAGFYRDFCAVAWGERANPTYSYWTTDLELNEFVLGQLIGRDPTIESDDALGQLTIRVRRQLACALESAFGGRDLLFACLWRTNEWVSVDDSEECERELTDDEILNDWTPDKQAAYQWLDQGAEVVLDPA